jgi:hypothetical protein
VADRRRGATASEEALLDEWLWAMDSEDALLDDALRLTLLLLLELALRLSERELKSLVDATVVAPSSESDRSSRREDTSAAVADERRSGSSLPPEKTSPATHMSAASTPSGTRPPDDGIQNSKSSGASESEAELSASACPPPRRHWGTVSLLVMDGFLFFWSERGRQKEMARFCFCIWFSCARRETVKEGGVIGDVLSSRLWCRRVYLYVYMLLGLLDKRFDNGGEDGVWETGRQKVLPPF